MIKKSWRFFLVLCSVLWMSAGSVWAADLKLDPDTLIEVRDKEARDRGKVIYVRADELFIGVGNEEFTFGDIENGLNRYGIGYKNYLDGLEGDFVAYEMPGLYFGIGLDPAFIERMEQTCGDLPQTWQLTEQQKQLLQQIHLNKDSSFSITFMGGYYDEATNDWLEYPASAADELIERIAIINHNGYTLKNGWVWEENAWRYYENDAMATGFKWIDGQLYCFEENGFMIHDGFREINGNKYHFNENWADRGWQTLTENGEKSWYYFSMEDAHALKGYVNGIEGDSFKYFFWQDGYTDQNGKTYPAGALAQGAGGGDIWICQNGSPVYMADKDGHLYVNMESELNGIRYNIDGNGNVTPVATYPTIDYSQRALESSVKQRTSEQCAIIPMG